MNRGALDLELDDELRFHFEQQVEQNIAAGMNPDEARIAVRREFGPLALHKDECRDARRTRMIESFFEDCRYAVRNLLRDPFLALTATLTLAVCIGANTTVFSVADSILIRPLPYPNSDRIDWISERTGPARLDVGAAPDYYVLREQSRVFEETGAFSPSMSNWTGVARPKQLDTSMATASFFRVMGTQPLLGRYLAADEEGPQAPPVVVLSYAFWRNELGGDPDVLGKTIDLDRLPHKIIGVMPQGFDLPRGTQLWLPLPVDKASQTFPISPTHPLMIVSILARVKPGVTPTLASTDMNRLTFAIRGRYPPEFRKNAFRNDLAIAATPLQQHLTGDVRPAILALTGAVGLVLLIACANIANLLLARAGSRSRELAVRLALGSGRGRIIRQMLTESLVLAVPGAAMGVGLAWLAVDLLNAAKPSILIRYPAISMDWRVLVFTIALMLGTAILSGLIPALSAAGIHVHVALKSAGLTHSAGRGAARIRKSLVVAEIGTSLVLLIGAGLLTRSFIHLAHTELGFAPDHLLTFRIAPVGPFIRDLQTPYREILSRLQHLPAVRSASFATNIPLGNDSPPVRIQVVGRPLVAIADRPFVTTSLVSPEFFRTLGIPLKSGRICDAHDSLWRNSAAPGPEAVVVNEAFVRQIFPGEDPLGRLINGPDIRPTQWSIIGVVGDVRGLFLGAEPPSTVYECAVGYIPLYTGFLLRTSVDPQSLIPAVERQIRAVDRDQPIWDIKTMDQRRDAKLAPERFQLMLLASFAGIAILLAAAGVYGTMSYLVARRTREIGIRMAMGARPADVLGMVLGETSTLVIFAIIAGLGGAWALTRFIKSMLFGTTALDPVTLALSSILLAVIALLACIGPIRRAITVNAIEVLRNE